jgi:hypothetical protein
VRIDVHRIVSPEPQVGSHAVPRPGKGFTVGYVVPTRIIIYIIRDSVRQCECRSAMESTPYCVVLILKIVLVLKSKYGALARYCFDSSFPLLWRFLLSRMPQSMDAGRRRVG